MGRGRGEGEGGGKKEREREREREEMYVRGLASTKYQYVKMSRSLTSRTPPSCFFGVFGDGGPSAVSVPSAVADRSDSNNTVTIVTIAQTCSRKVPLCVGCASYLVRSESNPHRFSLPSACTAGRLSTANSCCRQPSARMGRACQRL